MLWLHHGSIHIIHCFSMRIGGHRVNFRRDLSIDNGNTYNQRLPTLYSVRYAMVLQANACPNYFEAYFNPCRTAKYFACEKASPVLLSSSAVVVRHHPLT